MGNGSHAKQWIYCNKPNLKPYTSLNDRRFEEYARKWQYFEDWKEEIKNMEGKTKEEKATMILSPQTLDAWEMICKSLPACIKWLLQQGTKFINARVFCQDPLEQHFSKQRAAAGGYRSSNTDTWLRNEGTLHLQRNLSLKRRGANTETSQPQLDATPLPKRKKTVRRAILPME
ncbi:Heat stress transcription factor A-1 [Frankliniella fusca]|uniref:Heat stress transcription factor A-1 n=1 Tax=Frankliniella fusca TaxID=407009 RepID=A0AAE1H244_9NEOP|nr:Heat stress transcription factor A-1 [Frankliniella fusca]